MSQESYLWYLKAMQMTISVLIAVGIFARWNVAAKARKPLAFMFLIMAISYIIDLVLSLHYEIHPLMLRQAVGFGYGFGAMYNGILIVSFSYIYARALFVPQKFSFQRLLVSNSLLLVSGSIYAILSFCGYKPEPGYSMAELCRHLWDNPFALLWLLTMVCFEISIAYVSIASLRWLLMHRRNIQHNFSLVGDFRYYYIYVTVTLFYLTIPLGVITLWFQTNSSLKIFTSIGFIIIIILIYVFSYLQRDFYTEEQPIQDIATSDEDEDGDEDVLESQYVRANDRRLLEKLERLIQGEHIYTLPDLSAEMLACRMGVSRKKLYLFLKAQYKSSFSDYINGCRIDHAVQLLSNPDCFKLTLLEISEISGFNSVGTFTKFFKSRYNTTPAKYRNTILVQ